MVEPIEIVFLAVASFITSAWTAVIGMGGGIMLISILPGILPPEAIIPVHGLVQLASNISRAGFGLRDVVWRLIGPFAIGAVLGAALGTQLVLNFPFEYLPLLLGLFILFLIWAPRALAKLRLPGGFFSLGVIEAFLTLIVGVAGPLTAPFLLREQLGKDQIVVTGAVISIVAHALKVVAFGLLGFAFGAYLPLIGVMLVTVTLGSYAGTRLRHRVSEEFFIKLFKVVVTILALRMILSSLGVI